MSSDLYDRIFNTLNGCPGRKFNTEQSQWQLDRLAGEASNRIYFRVWPDKRAEDSLMAMVLPQGQVASEEVGGAGASGGTLPFIEMANWLSKRGIPVPVLHHYDEALRVLLLEDLGDLTMALALEKMDSGSLYKKAIDLLVAFQSSTENPEPALVARQGAMDRSLLSWELEHYVEWRLEEDLALDVSSQRAQLDASFSRLLDLLGEIPTRLSHRDFQSKNIMVGQRGELTLIDFQDALIAPYVYDLVALLRDSYVVLPIDEVRRHVSYYSKEARAAGIIQETDGDVWHHFLLQTIQRKLKDTGRFVFIDRVKDNPSFMQYRQPSMSYVHHALSELPELRDLRELLGVLDPL